MMDNISHHIDNNRSINNYMVIFGFVFYIILFPGYFVYLLLVQEYSIDQTPPYVGIVSSISLPFSLFAFYNSYLNRKISSIDVIVLVSFFYMILVALLGYATAPYEESAKGALLGMVIYLSVYLIIRGISVAGIDKNVYVNISHIFIISILLFNMLYLDASAGGAAGSFYQTMAAIVVFSLVIYIINSGKLISILMSVVTFYALFLIGARSEFLVFFFILLFLLVETWSGFFVLGISILSLSFFPSALFSLFDFLQNLPFNRVVDFFQNLESSGSLTERGYARDAAISTILDHPILGDFASYPPGLYSHDVLSSWVDFGIIGFLAHISIFPIAFIVTWRSDKALSRRTKIILLMIFLCFVLEVGSKMYAYLLTAMIMGYASGMKVRNG